MSHLYLTLGLVNENDLVKVITLLDSYLPNDLCSGRKGAGGTSHSGVDVKCGYSFYASSGLPQSGCSHYSFIQTSLKLWETKRPDDWDLFENEMATHHVNLNIAFQGSHKLDAVFQLK